MTSASNTCAEFRFRFGDFVLALAILLASVLLIGLWSGKQGTVAEISQNGRLLYTVDLSEPQTLTVEGRYHNVLRVENGTIRVIESDCPNQTCVHSGGVTAGTLCCVPNGMTVTVRAADVDAVIR